MGIVFDCPHCRKVRIKILFINPEDGHGPEKTGHYMGTTVSRQDAPGVYSKKFGNTFENLSLEQKIVLYKHWSGYIKDGNVIRE